MKFFTILLLVPITVTAGPRSSDVASQDKETFEQQGFDTWRAPVTPVAPPEKKVLQRAWIRTSVIVNGMSSLSLSALEANPVAQLVTSAALRR